MLKNVYLIRAEDPLPYQPSSWENLNHAEVSTPRFGGIKHFGNWFNSSATKAFGKRCFWYLISRDISTKHSILYLEFFVETKTTQVRKRPVTLPGMGCVPEILREALRWSWSLPCCSFDHWNISIKAAMFLPWARSHPQSGEKIGGN